MLVLSRKTDEEIVIGSNVTVKVLRVQGNRVYLGIDAPDEVGIRRAEIPAAPTTHEKPAAPTPKNKRVCTASL